jgi:acetyltransferase
MMEETKVYQLLRGFRNAPPANIKLLEETMVQFSQLLVDFPEIKEVDINPFFVGEKDAYALDARMVIDDKIVLARPEPHSHLVIGPYPRKYETLWRMRDGRTVLLRPIRPEDEPMWLEMFQNFSERSIRYRFFQMVKDTPHEVRVRYCNVDYEREIGIVVELTEDGKKKIAGVVRLIIEPDNKTGEVAIVVADPWQNLGLGTKMMDHMIEICKDKKLEVVYGELLKENYRAIDLMKKMGFVVEKIDQDTVKATLNLRDEICP